MTRRNPAFFALFAAAAACAPEPPPRQPQNALPPRTMPTFGRGAGPGAAASASPFDLAVARGDQALRRGQYDEARAQFETAQRLNPRDARPEFYLGEVSARQERWAEAEPHLRAALRLDPRMPEAHAELGTTLRQLNHNDEAAAEFQAALRLDPGLAEAHLNLGLLLEDANQPARAAEEYRAAARAAADDPIAPLNLGILLANLHPAPGSPERAEAVGALQSAVRNAGQDLTVLASAGPALRQLGEYASAVDALERARAAASPPSPSLLGELAQALFAAGNHALARQRAAEAVQLAPDRADVRMVQGLLAAADNDRAAAATILREAARLGAGTPVGQRAQQALAALEPRPAAAPPNAHPRPRR